MHQRIRNLFQLLCCVIFLGAAVLPAQENIAAKSPSGKLKFVIILSRHGVRSPTWTQERLNAYSSQPWPTWSVPPGNLTPRGFQLIKLFGGFDREQMSSYGLLSARGCTDASAAYIWADTDERTLESGRALAEGLFPGCAVKVHSLGAGENDPLFHSTAEGVSPERSSEAFADISAAIQRQDISEQPVLLREMQRVLQGCSPAADCVPVRRPQLILPGTTTSAARGKGDHVVDLQGPLPQASSFAEDFLLEYADGMPMQDVGWGKVDEAQLRRFLALHSEYFGLAHRTPAIARLEASNLLLHIERTLQQHVTGAMQQNVLGDMNTRVVMLAGHDTSIAPLAEMLGLHWHLDGREDDTPPGTELAFELWQDAHGEYFVHITVAMQSLQQLRNMQPLTIATPPLHQSLKLESWRQFYEAAEAQGNAGKNSSRQ